MTTASTDANKQRRTAAHRPGRPAVRLTPETTMNFADQKHLHTETESQAEQKWPVTWRLRLIGGMFLLSACAMAGVVSRFV